MKNSQDNNHHSHCDTPRRLTSCVSAALTLGLLFACASNKPSTELKDARDAYQSAKGTPESKLAPTALYDAEKALRRAEKAHTEEPQSMEEKQLAYIAERKAELAMAKAGLAFANETTQRTRNMLAEKRTEKLEASRQELQQKRAELEQTDEQLESTKDKLSETREARLAAEQRAAAAVERLKEIAKVKAESRDVVITLDGAVLFATGEHVLQQAAMRRLEQVAEMIDDLDPDAELRVVGHTDSRGEASMNMTLSRQRAQSVADYLIRQGIDASRVSVEARGESQPIASNDSPEGRANNRRVEIVVVGAGKAP